MALSQDEQRVLAEIERRLAADDPGLANCLASFRRPGPATVLRSPRARIVGSLFTVLLVAMVSLMVYAMIPFRDHIARTTTSTTSAAAPTNVAISAAGAAPLKSQSASAGTSNASSTPNRSAAPSTSASSARSRAASAKAKAKATSQTNAAQATTTAASP
jgi:Protein of unknown function (DUF3040)